MIKDQQKFDLRNDIKKIDVNGDDYFFYAKTNTVFKMKPEKAAELEKLVEDPQMQVSDNLPTLISKICSQKTPPDAETTNGVGLTLILTENCNLRCTYCWEHQDRSKRHMTSETALNAVDFLIQTAVSRDRSNMTMSFFGGEPLLRWEVIHQLISYAESQAQEKGSNIRFSITTNGTLLNEKIIDFLSQHQCEVTISFDGPAHIHDAQRLTLNSVSSHALAVRALNRLINHIPPRLLHVLMTVHHESLPYLEESVEYMRSLGIQNIGVNPIRAFGLPNDSKLAFTAEDYVEFANYLKRKTLEFDSVGENPYASVIRYRYLDRVDLNVHHHVRCGAGINGFSVGIDGYIYPCGGFAFEKAYAIGHVSSGLDAKLVERFIQDRSTVDDSPACSECWARYLCGGGCYLQSFSRLKDLRRPWLDDCLCSKIMIESALSSKVELVQRSTRSSKKSQDQ